jgi:uncharacterized protein YbjT (DUF2867 family)
MAKTAVILGSTGLIGSHLLDLLLQDSDYTRIRILVRRPVSHQHPKLETCIVNFDHADEMTAGIQGADVVFCSIGTTKSKVKGDMTAYRKIDFDIPVAAAAIAAKSGVKHFLLVSSVGADSGSNNFYLKLKGEVEDAITKMAIPAISVFRPSMLLGSRNESRPAEYIGQQFVRMFNFLIPSEYKGIIADQVAKAMLRQSKKDIKGTQILHYRDMVAE